MKTKYIMGIRHKNHYKSKAKRCAGFSLIELAIVILVASLAVTPLYKMLLVKPLDEGTEMTRILSGLSEHLRVHGTLPCPARLDLDTNNANYSTEGDCTANAGVTVVNGMAIGAVPTDTLKVAMDCLDFFETDNERATALDLIVGNSVARKSMASVRDTLVAGSSDAKLDITGCIADSDIIDKYGNKFLYAVDISATTAPVNAGAVFDRNAPSSNILVQDIGGASVTAINPNFIVLSHGQDGNGGFDKDGNAIFPCGANLDSQNCNNNGTFLNIPARIINTATYFDDTMDFSLAGYEREEDYWNWAGNAGARDLSFSNPALGADASRMIIDTPTGIDNTTAADKLVVNNGDLEVNGATGEIAVDVEINATQNIIATLGDITATDGNLTVNDPGGTGNGNIDADGDITSVTQFNSPIFCYEPYNPATSDPGCAP